jgi:hypothetical protein
MARAQFAQLTNTAAVGDLVAATCSGPAQVEPGVLYVSVGGCQFTMKNGNVTTTFGTSVQAAVVLKGTPDPFEPNDPVTHQEPPAPEDIVRDLGVQDVYVVDGLAPAVPAPFPFADAATLHALAQSIAQHQQLSPIVDDGGIGCRGDSQGAAGADRTTFAPHDVGPGSDVQEITYCYHVDDPHPFYWTLDLVLQLNGGTVVGIREARYSGRGD